MGLLTKKMMIGASYAAITISLSTTSVGGSSSSSTVTSSTVTATLSGGSPVRTLTWQYVSGDSSVLPTNSSNASTQFQKTGMSVGATSAVYRLAAKDGVTGITYYSNNVSIYLERSNPALSVSTPADIIVYTPSSSSITVSGSTSISVSGGVPPYTIVWSKSGDFVISPSGTSCTASRVLAPTGGVSGPLYATVTDSINQSTTVSCGVVLINNGSVPPTLSASVSPSVVYGLSDSGDPVSDPATVTPSGGVAPYGYAWSLVSGEASATAPSSATSQFGTTRYTNGTVDSTMRCVVTDSSGQSYPVTLTVRLTVWFNPN